MVEMVAKCMEKETVSESLQPRRAVLVLQMLHVLYRTAAFRISGLYVR